MGRQVGNHGVGGEEGVLAGVDEVRSKGRVGCGGRLDLIEEDCFGGMLTE